MFVAERAGRETLIFEVVGSKPIRSKVLLVRDLILFLICFIKLVFGRVLTSVCEVQFCLCVYKYVQEN